MSVGRFAPLFLAIATWLTAAPLWAQDPAPESVNTIVQRGHVAHWLVCGPFPADVPGGILAALKAGQPVLGTTDYMATVNGIARIRPQHLMRVPAPDGSEAIWQRAGTPAPELDLKPFFPSSPEGVAYAAFYANSPRASAIFLDIQSPFGVRIWANGFPVQEYNAAPFAEAGLTQVAIPMRAGANLVVLQVPGADFESVADALGRTTRQLAASDMANRPRLRETSGFAVSVVAKAAQPLGRLFVVPDLEDAGTFSGGPGDERQDAWLTLYNPQDVFSEPGDVLVTVPGVPLPELIEVEPMEPRSVRRIPVALPIENAPDGEALSVSVRLHMGGAEAAFTDAFVVRPGTSQPGSVRVVTGHTFESAGVPDARLEVVRGQLAAWRAVPGYGFDLTYASAWHPVLVGLPDQQENLLAAVQQGGVTLRAPYAPVDERLVSGPLLWRNLQIGMGMARGMLRSAVPQQLYWDAPGMAPQTPQLLANTPVTGFVSDLDAPGQYPLARQLAPGGGTRFHRHKRPADGPTAAAELREMVAVQRRELLALGIADDVLVLNNVVAPPEPFYRGSVAELASASPRILLDAAGATGFFETLGAMDSAVLDALPASSVYLNQGKPGDLLTWPALKRAQAQATQLLFEAESLATFASLSGATYPHSTLDLANRQLLYYSTPDTLAAPASDEVILDALSGLREVAELTRDVAERSLAFLAGKVDTSGTVPLNQGEFQAILVFNPTGQTGALPVDLLLPGPVQGGIALVDDGGQPVAATLRPYQQSSRLEFMADGVPPFGYRTYFYQPGGAASRAVKGADLQIENESLAVFVDPDSGAIASITDKATGRELRGGLINQLVLLDEDGTRTRAGRELWTTPGDRLPPMPTEILSEHAAFRESIIVRTALAGGTVEQRYTLNAGQPWVACGTTLKDLRLGGTALFASFQLPDAGRTFLVGERLGALVGARGWGLETLQTYGADYPGGTVSYPAQEWVALAPGDGMQVGADRVVPWGPALIVHGPDPLLESAARALQSAFAGRGIPSVVHPDQPAKADFLWTDGTREVESNAYLEQGYRTRIIIGSPDQNTFGKTVLAQITAPDAANFNERIPQGARLLMEDTRVPEGALPVPTLVLAGLTPSQTAGLVTELTRSITMGQRYLVPPSACLIPRLEEPADDGVAVLFPGSLSASQHRDGRLLIGLAHDAGIQSTSEGARSGAMLGEAHFDYGIYPFSGTWRDAEVPAMAERANARAYAAVTGIHPGPLPATRSFLRVSDPGLRVAAIKPAGFPHTTGNRAAFHPRNGVSLLAWESTGESWNGTLASDIRLLEARRADVYEAPGEAVPMREGSIALTTGPFEVVPLWLLPAPSERPDPLAVLGRESEPHGTIHTRYWDAGRGAAPQQNLPLTILLRGSLAGDRPTVEVVVTNHLTDQPVEGMAILSASHGVSFGPQQFYFNLTPGKQHIEAVEVAFTPDAGSDRSIAVETSFERQTYRDVLTVEPGPVTMTLTRNGAQIRAEIRNDGSIHAEGAADLITGPAHWGELGDFVDVSAMPRRAAVSVPPYKVQTVIFTLSDPESTLESAIRLSTNGKVQYQYVSGGALRPAPAAAPAAPAVSPAPPGGRTTPTPPPPRGRSALQP